MTGPSGAFPARPSGGPVRPRAGSTDGHHRAPATGARTATSVTPDSRPAPAAPVSGTITGATAVSTDHSVELTAPAPGGACGHDPGPAYSLASAGSGTEVPASGRARQDPRLPGRSSNLTFGAE